MLHPGLYEQVINSALNSELSTIPEARKAIVPIDKAEASKVLAQYLADVVQKALDNVIDNGGDISAQIALTNQIVDLIQTTTEEADFASMGVAQRAEQLLALLRENDPRLLLGKTAADMERPETSVAQSSLFTGAIHEPQMFSELKKEINSADQIEMLVSFIKWSGLRLIMDELREFTQNGGQLRIITTSYMGATDIKAIEELSKLPNTEIKVSYDTKRTRLHAKTYVFYRDTGFTTAYVGSSNLSNAAISSGLEWNVKVTAKDLPSTIQKIIATFDSYWNSSEFEFYKEEERERLFRALRAERMMGDSSTRSFVFDIHPYPYQQEILDKLNAEREVRGRNRNLVVAATGTGKTVISAFDYRRFCKANLGQRNRLLFVAHREEILKQSRDKSDKEYSPTTMYNDYSINEELFHWQSQSTTTDTGSVGQRYIHHRERSSKVLLFVREFKSDLVGAAPYTFLGMANYVKHTGSRPMNITWKLDHPIPAKYLKKTQKLVVG